MNYDEKCQILIIGDSTVGKTSILYRYMQDKFQNSYLATVGVDYFTKDVSINDKIIRVKIWDTAGQERFKSITTSFFRNAQGIILVYDVTNKETFLNLKYWIESIYNNINPEEMELKMIIIGNKVDLQREVDKEEAENYAKSINLSYYEVSAKDNININESMSSFIKSIFNDGAKQSIGSIRLTRKSSNKVSSDSSICSC